MSELIEFENDDFLETDLEFRRTLQLFFVKSYRNLYQNIREKVSEGDINAAYRLVHSLKGNAGQIEKMALQKAAVEVERLLKDGKNNVTEDLFNTLETELNAVITELSPLLNETQ